MRYYILIYEYFKGVHAVYTLVAVDDKCSVGTHWMSSLASASEPNEKATDEGGIS